MRVGKHYYVTASVSVWVITYILDVPPVSARVSCGCFWLHLDGHSIAAQTDNLFWQNPMARLVDMMLFSWLFFHKCHVSSCHYVAQ